MGFDLGEILKKAPVEFGRLLGHLRGKVLALAEVLSNVKELEGPRLIAVDELEVVPKQDRGRCLFALVVMRHVHHKGFSRPLDLGGGAG